MKTKKDRFEIEEESAILVPQSVDQRFKDGDPEAFVKIHEVLCRRYKFLTFKFNVEFEDLKGIIAESMLKLKNRYDPQNTKFTTYFQFHLADLVHKIKKFTDLIRVTKEKDVTERQALSVGAINETTRQRLLYSAFSLDAPIGLESKDSTFHEIIPSRDIPVSEAVGGELLIQRIAVIITTEYPDDNYAQYILETLQQKQTFPSKIPKKGPYSELRETRLKSRIHSIKKLLRADLS